MSKWIFIDGLNASWHTDPRPFAHLREGRLTAVNATVAASHDTSWTLDTIGRLLEHVERNSHEAIVVTTIEQINEAAEQGKVGYIMGLQDTKPIGGKLNLIPVFYRLGVRVVQLTYNFENRCGCGCQCEQDTGLTEFGREVISRMNALGMLLDLSHTGVRTSLQAIEASQAPVALTHANLSTTRDHPRNKPPEVVRAVAESGGVIGAVAFPPLLREDATGSVEDYLAAIDELVELVGPEHVGLGPDFMEAIPTEVVKSVLSGLGSATVTAFKDVVPLSGFSSPADFPRLAEAMLRHGYSEHETRDIMGANWLRLYGQVWRST